MYYGLKESNIRNLIIIIKDRLFLDAVYNGAETCFDDFKTSLPFSRKPAFLLQCSISKSKDTPVLLIVLVDT